MSFLNLDYKQTEDPVWQRINCALSEDVTARCESNGLKLSAFCEQAWAIVLSRYTSSPCVTFAVTSNDLESTSLMSCETTIEPDTPIVDLLNPNSTTLTPSSPETIQCNTAVLSCELHDRDVNASPLQIMISISHSGVWLLHSPGISSWHANNLASTFEMALCEIASQPARAIKDMNILGGRGKQQISEWNGRPLRRDVVPVVDAIRKHAVERPNHPAICAWDGNLTYSEFNDITERLAHHLRNNGIRENSLVLVGFDKSINVMIAIASVLKAGAGFVPVSPHYPTARMQIIAEVTESPLAITSPEFSSAFERVQVPALALTSSFIAGLPKLDHFQGELPGTDMKRIAYVMFTSGSTGRPKGVVHTHRSFSALVNQTEGFQISSSSRVLQFVPTIFAAMLVDVIIPLISGATICIASQYDLMNNLEATVDQMGVTFTIMTPSASMPIDPAKVKNLRTLCLVGEPTSEAVLKKWTGSVKLISAFGLSEVCAGACMTELHASNHSQNIGTSISGRLWLADPLNLQRAAPVGSIGEILFSGDNVSDRYLNEPEKTIAMYIEPPGWVLGFNPDPIPPRMLRTGDLARYLEDGSIVYVGRKDTQVKIRGKRIELGEVESTIRPHRPQKDIVITEAVSPSDMEGMALLICFIHSAAHQKDQVPDSLFAKPSEKFSQETEDIDVSVRAALPDYMVPSIYIPLAQIPKTGSGKTDRLGLRKYASGMTWQELEVYVHRTDEPRVQPETDMQRSLHALFCEILNRSAESIGINEAFLKLGGDSIQAIRLVQLCRSHGLDISVQDLLDNGTIAKLAESVKEISGPAVEMGENEAIPTDAALEQVSKLGIETDKVETIEVCSAMQEGILMSQLKSPDQHALRVLYEVEIPENEEKFDLEQFKRAWKQLALRHPLLRSLFVTNVTPRVFALQVQLKDEAALQVHRLNETLDPSSISLKKQQGARISSSALPQLSVYLEPHGRIFVDLELSHAVTDGMSMSILVKDLCSLYSAQTLSPLAFRHADYANYKNKSADENALYYWKEYLGGMDSCLFPTAKSDLSSPNSTEPQVSPEFKSVSVDVGPAETYHKFVRETGTTLAGIVKLAWFLVLRTMTRTDDVCFGYLIAGRDAPIDGLMDAVGPLIDLMICRQRFEPNTTVSDLLRSIQSDFLKGLPHRGASFADIRRALDFGRDEVMFNTCITQYPLSASHDSNDTPMSLREILRHDPNEFDLGLEVLVSDLHISTRLKAYHSVVPEDQMQRVGALFGHIMRTIVTSPEKDIEDLELTSDEDCAMIKKLNDRVTDHVDQCAHEIIKSQCQAQPSAPAVNAWDGDWTYKEFDDVSTSISRHLISQGVTPDTFVPVLMDKSRWVPVSLLGILKAGAAFVLLEPSQPIQRLQEICGDLRSSVIISSANYRHIADALIDKVVVLGNDLPIPAADEVDVNVCMAVGPRNLAYAVFTSGSTGKPKGVMVEHRALCTTGASMMRHSPMKSDMRMYQYASFAFDVSVLDLIVCFMAGGCLCIPSFEDRQNRLLESLNEFQANYVALTPTVTRTLQPENLTSLKTLKVSGEALTAFDIQRWGAAPGIQFINMYGPAECTINVTVQAPVTLRSPPLAIGQSMSNSTAWVVNPKNHERLCPVGAVGELIIQGPVVARGYLNRPEQTSAAFISPPGWLSRFMTVPPEEKLYKTGDLVQYAADGTFLYKGRKDSQVKLRGQRLELGEVEEHLRRAFPNSSEVIAEVASLNQGKTKALAAFIYQDNWKDSSETGTPSFSPNSETGDGLLYPACDAFSRAVAHARADLAASLPNYMEPTIYLPLAQIPQTRSGKTDRGRLRQILSTGLHEKWAGSLNATASRQAPRNEAETVLCAGVAETLSLQHDDVGMEDNFFRRGGDSVAAMMLVSLLRGQGYHITVADIFQNPRLESLAKVMHCDLPSSVSDVPPPFALLDDEPSSRKEIIQQAMDQCAVPEEDIEDMYPCSPLQHAFFLFSARKKGTLIVQRAYNLRPVIDLDLLRRAWDKTVLAHPQLRTRIVDVEGKDEMYQVVLRGRVEVEYHEPPADDVSDYLPDLSIDVAPGKPLLRIALVRRPSTDQHRLLISVQHSMYDGWSLELLMKEFERSYSGDALNHLPTSSFIRHIKKSKEADEQFWTEELKDLRAPNFPEMPSSDYIPHPSATLNKEVSIPDGSTGQFTLSTKIRWAWAQVISLYTGSSEVALGLGTAGRGTPVAGIEKMMTPTLGIFPYRLYINSDDTVTDALRKAQDNYVNILPHEHYGNPNISKLATGPTSAVALQTLLIVQPQPPEQPSSLYSEQELLPQTGAFHVRALSLHCYLQKDSVGVFACYDERVLPEQEMLRAVSLFETIFKQICHEPEIPVRELKGLSPVSI